MPVCVGLASGGVGLRGRRGAVVVEAAPLPRRERNWVESNQSRQFHEAKLRTLWQTSERSRSRASPRPFCELEELPPAPIPALHQKHTTHTTQLTAGHAAWGAQRSRRAAVAAAAGPQDRRVALCNGRLACPQPQSLLEWPPHSEQLEASHQLVLLASASPSSDGCGDRQARDGSPDQPPQQLQLPLQL